MDWVLPIVEYFYNVFGFSLRMEAIEKTFPIFSLEDSLPMEEVMPGTLRFIINKEREITSVTIYQEDGTWADPIPFSLDLKSAKLSDDVKQVAESYGLTGTTYYDILKSIFSITMIARNATFVTLKASNWSGTAAPFSQSVPANGAESSVKLIPVSVLADGAGLETQKAYSKAFGIVSSGTVTGNGGIATFKVYKKPAIDIVVGLKGV